MLSWEAPAYSESSTLSSPQPLEKSPDGQDGQPEQKHRQDRSSLARDSESGSEQTDLSSSPGSHTLSPCDLEQVLTHTEPPFSHP